jgi:hypothetical protein
MHATLLVALLATALPATPVTPAPELAQELAAALPPAVAAGDVARVEALLARGADANQLGKFRLGMLAVACERGDVAMANLLLDAGASVETTSAWGETPLFPAVRHAPPALVERLLAAGADPNARAKFGRRPLMLAAGRGEVAIVDRLLNAGAELEAAAEGGVTALHFAAAAGNVEAAKRLVAAGARLDARSSGGADPRLVALEAGHRDLADWLAGEMRRSGLTPVERPPQPTAWDRVADVPWEEMDHALDGCVASLRGGRSDAAPGPCAVEGTQVLFGDLTGDGAAEAVVALHLRPAGDRRAVRVLVYGLRESRPVRLGQLPASGPPAEALDELRIDAGDLVVGFGEGNVAMPHRWRVEGGELRLVAAPPR